MKAPTRGLTATPCAVGGVAAVQNHAPGGVDGLFLVSESTLTGCALSHEELACGVRRAVYDSGCHHAPEDGDFDITVHPVEDAPGTLCEGDDVYVEGVNYDSVLSAHVDGEAARVSGVNDTHVILRLPPLDASALVEGHVVGMQLDDAAEPMARSLVLNVTLSATSDAEARFVVKRAAYAQRVKIADLSCGMRQRHLFSGDLVSLTELEGSNNAQPVDLAFSAGRHGFNGTALNATAAATLLPLGPSFPENYTVAAWIQLPQVDFAIAPDGWTHGPRPDENGTIPGCAAPLDAASDSTDGSASVALQAAVNLENAAADVADCMCGSHHSHELPAVPPCVWKFATLRVARGNRTLTVGSTVMDPDHAIAEALAAERGLGTQLRLSGLIVDELTVWNRVLFDEEVLRLLATDSYAVRIGGESGGTMVIEPPPAKDASYNETGVAVTYWQPSDAVEYNDGTVEQLGSTEAPVKEFLPLGLDVRHAAGEGPYPTTGAEAVYDCVVAAPWAGAQEFMVGADDGVAIYVNGTRMGGSAANLTHVSTDNVPLGHNVAHEAATAGELTHFRIVHRNNAADGTSIRLLFNSTNDATGTFEPATCRTASGRWSIAAWIRPDKTLDNGDKHYVFTSSEWSVAVVGAGVQVALKRDTCQHYTPYISTTGVDCTRSDLYTLPDVGLLADSWNHLAVAVTETAVSVYVGGQLRAMAAADATAHKFAAVWPSPVTAGSEDAPLSYLLHSVRLVARAVTAEDVAAMHACDTAAVDNTIAFYTFDEGSGRMLEGPMLSGEAPANGRLWSSEWLDATCGDAPATNETVHVCDAPHQRGMVAGKPVKYALQARDACGKAHRVGGHCVDVSAVHTNGTAWAASLCSATAAAPDGGDISVADMADGTYEITQVLTLAGNYTFTVLFDGGVVVNETLTVHPGVADAGQSWVEEIPSPGGLMPVADATVGVPAKLRVHLMDAYGNAKDWSAMTDEDDEESGEFEVAAAFLVAPGDAPQVHVTDARDGTVDVDFMPMVAGAWRARCLCALAGCELCICNALGEWWCEQAVR